MAERTSRREGPLVAAGALLPRWALTAGAAMLAVGVILAATRGARQRHAAVALLNDTPIRVTEYEDGLQDNFGLVTLLQNAEGYQRVLGDCETRPEMARAVFRQVLAEGNSDGRILSCGMAFYLAQRDMLDLEDVQLIVKQLDAESPELRRAAQRTFANLLLLRGADKASLYEQLPAAPDAKAKLEAKTKSISPLDAPAGSTWLTIRWSNAQACKAWWQKFGPKAAWDPGLKRFVIAEGL